MELELGLGLPHAGTGTTEMMCLERRDGECCSKKKRRYEEAFERTTLPLFDGCDDDSMSDGEVADSDPCNDDCKQVLYHDSRTSKELVGWPPVKCSWTRGGSDAEQGSYVKVTMEGVLIGRKLDLSLHNSYQDLFNTLDRMFPAYKHPAEFQFFVSYKISIATKFGGRVLEVKMRRFLSFHTHHSVASIVSSHLLDDWNPFRALFDSQKFSISKLWSCLVFEATWFQIEIVVGLQCRWQGFYRSSSSYGDVRGWRWRLDVDRRFAMGSICEVSEAH